MTATGKPRSAKPRKGSAKSATAVVRSLSTLVPDDKNANRGTLRGTAMIEDSFQKYGAGRSILVDKNNRVIAGNKSLQSAVDAGFDDAIIVPSDGKRLVVVQRTDLDIDTPRGRQLAILDNRTSEVSLDWDADVLRSLQDDGVDLSALWDADELADLLGTQDEPAADPGAQLDKAAELQAKYKTAVGQVWQLDAHRLAIGDCGDKKLVDRLMQGERATAVVTDPPYGINRDGIANDTPEGLAPLFKSALVSMPIDDAVIICFQSPRLFMTWIDECRNAGHRFERSLWLYRTGQSSYPWRGWYMRSDIILVSTIGDPQWASYPPAVTDCYEVNINDNESVKATEVGSGSLHSTIKPIDVIENLVAHTEGLVYDPFVGSGTTIIACERLQRQCRAVEIDPSYAAVTIQRWEALTGRKAVLCDA